MKQATHNGTCQVCGRLQALPGGYLAKHGYTVEHHYFAGVCPGANHLPLELDRKFADEAAAGLLVDAAAADRDFARVQSGDKLPSHASAGFHARTRAGKLETVEVPFEDATAANKAEAVRKLAVALARRAAMGRAISAEIIARADKITGKQEIAARVADTKREIAVGMRVKVYGQVRTIAAIETRVVRGCGPHLNGQHLPHAVFESGAGVPLRLIRQSAIVE